MIVPAATRTRASHRVVVTGLGAVSCLGTTASETWDNMVAGNSGIRHISAFDLPECPIRVAGEVRNFDAVERLGKEWAGKGFQYCQYALAASLEAIAHAGLDVDAFDFTKTGISIANAHGVGWFMYKVGIDARHKYGYNDFEALRHGWELIASYREEPYEESAYSPEMVFMMSNEAATDLVGLRIGSIGPRFTVSSACVSGARAVDRAFRWLKRGQCEMVIAGGAEVVVEPNGIWALNAMKALSAHQDEPEGASRPFDKNRSGFVLAEGSGMMVLETLEHAQKRGAPILAELVGCGGSANAYSLFAPESAGAGPSGAMNGALKSAGMNYDEIDAVFAHATATGIGDPAEAEGIKMTFKDHTPNVSVTAPKSMMGHSIGAAGALGAVACVQSIMHQAVPPTINMTDPEDFTRDMRIVNGIAEERPINAVLNNAFGFGGSNGSNIFKRFPQ